MSLEMRRGDHAVVEARFSPDGALLATVSSDGILVWDARTGRPRRTHMVGHDALVTSLEFSHDGRTLASGGLDQRIFLWDTETGRVVSHFTAPQRISSLDIDPHGRWLVAGGGGEVHAWNLSMDWMLTRACSLLSPGIDADAWARLLPDVPAPMTCPSTPSN